MILGSEFVVVTTIFCERKLPHPRWVVEAGWREKIGRIFRSTKEEFSKSKIPDSSLVGTPTKKKSAEKLTDSNSPFSQWNFSIPKVGTHTLSKLHD
ncbi:hypothetical protein [Leptospira tipperaryensis]|uniref:hypothetical protein n=1 Tax=Leptospira tipperaryensis TaxID=2564040 RepID=UPI0012E9E22F|nr:hypothetical protein [Leptospira tipperaryensis]